MHTVCRLGLRPKFKEKKNAFYYSSACQRFSILCFPNRQGMIGALGLFIAILNGVPNLPRGPTRLVPLIHSLFTHRVFINKRIDLATLP